MAIQERVIIFSETVDLSGNINVCMKREYYDDQTQVILDYGPPMRHVTPKAETTPADEQEFLDNSKAP